MCRALTVLCAAPGPDRLRELKRAAVSVHWELVGGAASVEELADQLVDWKPDVLVLDSGLDQGAVERCREAQPGIRIIVVGATEIEGVREAILGVPGPGGPVGARPATQPPRTP
jgi:DNA-binding NarL/FixJ family response regulator